MNSDKKEEVKAVIRKIIQVGTDVRLLSKSAGIAEAEKEKLTLAKLALERAEKLLSEICEGDII